MGVSAVNAQTTFGVRAGVNLTNVYGKDMNGVKMSNNLIPGFNVGVNAEIPLATEFYLQPGVLFTTKGAEYDRVDGQNYTRTARLAYIEVPVNLLYKPMVGRGHLLAGFGPYVDFGLGGKVTYEGPGAPGERDVRFKSRVTASDDAGYSYYRPVGAGGNLLFGYEFANKLSFQLNTQLGVTDIFPEDDTRPSAQGNEKHIGFGISAGYRF